MTAIVCRPSAAARLSCLLVALSVSAPAGAATVVSGTVTSEETQEILPNVGVGVTRASEIPAANAGTAIPVEWSTTTDAAGVYSLTLDESLPGMDRLYVFTWHHTVFNEIFDSVDSSGMAPRPGDLTAPDVVTIDLTAGPATGVDFEVGSSLRNEMVLMRDGVTGLATDIWLPSRRPGLSWPVLLSRTPYDTLGQEVPRAFTAADYAVVQQNTRGRFDSEGTDEVFDDDGWRDPHRDGYDAVEWIAAQPWSNGTVGMFGLSASGITEYLAAGAAPPSLVCAIADFATGDLYRHGAYPGGEFRKHLIETWLADQGSLHKLPEWKSHPLEDAYWDERNLANRIAQVQVPMMHIGGWYDTFTEGTLGFYGMLQDSGGEGARRNQKLLAGPWIHSGYFDPNQGQLSYPLNSVLTTYPDMLVRWFDFWLKGKDTGVMDDPPVRYYVMGPGLPEGLNGPGNAWRNAPEWPPAVTTTSYYLQPGGTLSTTPPSSSGGESVYTSDPNNPVPTDGGGNLYVDIGQGPIDQSTIDARTDVLVWQTLPLAAPLEVTGAAELVLYASSDRPDTDWVVKLEDVYPDGRVMLVTDHILKARHRVSFAQEDLLTPGTVYEFRIKLWETSLAFNLGHRLRVAIASSNYPRFEVNPQTGEPFDQHTSMQVATNRIQHSAAWPSRLELPVADPVALTGCRPTEAVDGLTVEKLTAPGEIRLSWSPVTDGCHLRYRVYAGIQGPQWPWIVRRPIAETTDTFFETQDAGVFWQVVSEGTDGGNGPHGPQGGGTDDPGRGKGNSGKPD